MADVGCTIHDRATPIQLYRTPTEISKLNATVCCRRHEHIMAACGRHFERALGMLLALDLLQSAIDEHTRSFHFAFREGIDRRHVGK